MSEGRKYFGKEFEQQTQAVEEFTCDFLLFRYGDSAIVTRDVNAYTIRSGLKLPDLLIDFGPQSRKVVLEITTTPESFGWRRPSPKREERELYAHMAEKIPYIGGLIVYQQHIAKSAGFELLSDVIFDFAHGSDYDISQATLDSFAKNNSQNVWPATQVNWIQHMENMRRYFGMK